MAGTRIGRTLACLLLFPILGIVLTVAGAIQVGHWGALTASMKIIAVLMLGVGGLMVLAIAGLMALAFLLRRFARGVKRDAKSLAWSIRYMLRMGR